jgi:hypothetical protein
MARKGQEYSTYCSFGDRKMESESDVGWVNLKMGSAYCKVSQKNASAPGGAAKRYKMLTYCVHMPLSDRLPFAGETDIYVEIACLQCH